MKGAVTSSLGWPAARNQELDLHSPIQRLRTHWWGAHRLIHLSPTAKLLTGLE